MGDAGRSIGNSTLTVSIRANVSTGGCILTGRSATLTAAMIDSREFLAAKRRSETEPVLPTGTRIAFTSGHAYHDHNRIWALLDKVLAKYPHMVLFHGRNPTGGEHIAVWARARKITHAPFRADGERFEKAAPFRRNDQMLETLPRVVVACPGNGIMPTWSKRPARWGFRFGRSSKAGSCFPARRQQWAR